MIYKVDRIILDTNRWISFLITKNFSQIDQLLFSGKCVLVFIETLLSEFIDVATGDSDLLNLKKIGRTKIISILSYLTNK